jgi:hypothetical protein
MTTKTGPVPASQTTQDTQARRQEPRDEQRREQAQLVRCYGSIGISAVAAALRYAGVSKNPAYAPVVHRPESRFASQAA